MDYTDRSALAGAIRGNRGLLTPRLAAGEGISGRQLRRARERGELERRRQRVYVPNGVVLDWSGELAADLNACLADAVASHTAALRLHAVEHHLLRPKRELVVVGSARPTVRSLVVIHRTGVLDPVDRTRIADIPCTTPGRTLIDLAGRLSVAERLKLLDDAIMQGVIRRGQMHVRASALKNGRRGVTTLAGATAVGAEHVFKSRLEKLGLPLLVQAGLTDPAVNVVPDDAREAGIMDVVSEAAKLIVDWDGLRFHSHRRARQRDNDQANHATLGGYTCLRFTWSDVTSRPGYVVATTRRAVARPR